MSKFNRVDACNQVSEDKYFPNPYPNISKHWRHRNTFLHRRFLEINWLEKINFINFSFKYARYIMSLRKIRIIRPLNGQEREYNSKKKEW